MAEGMMPADFRAAMASFAAGVTVVTTLDSRDGPHALTATAFSSLSASPPLCLVCVDRRARAHPALMASKSFAVNILSTAQRALSTRFSDPTGDKFAGVDWSRGRVTGCPFIPGSIAFVECETVKIYDGGDHDIFVGRLLDVNVRDGEPLVYFRGAYAALAGSS